jgi:hypothetical protein
MQPDQARVAIDYGTVTTVAAVAWPDGRWVRLTLDGGLAMTNAAMLLPGTDPLVGAEAWHAAAQHPEHFVDTPLTAGTGTLTVGDAEVQVQDAVTASLRRVAAEAYQVAGGSVTDVRIVVPAGWGPRRRTWMRSAAYRAGLGQPFLVEAPVAAADHLVAGGVQLPVGAFLLVCDLGGGFEVTVLRRGPTGFEILSTLADPDVGGTSLDHALAVSVNVPRPGGSAPVGGGDRWAVLSSARIAKEALSTHPAVTVMLPAPSPAAVVNSTTMDQLAQPVMKRVADLTAKAVAAAEITAEQLAGVYCIGAGSLAPWVARTIGERIGVTATVVPDPGAAAMLGALQAGGHNGAAADPPAAVRIPPVRRVVTLAVPGLASLAVLAHFLFSASLENESTEYFYILANWGELAMAALFAVIACIAAGSLLGATLTLVEETTPWGGPPSPGRQTGTGILVAAVGGIALAGMYAVLAGLFFGVPMSSPLRWALYPVLPVAVIAAVVAVIAARHWRVPRQGWDGFLAFPPTAVACAAAGTVLVQFAMSTAVSAAQVLPLNLAGRFGGLLIGVGVAAAIARQWVLRLVIAVPMGLFCAAIVSWQATGILAVIFTVAVLLWWARSLWDLIRSPLQAVHNAR